MFWASPYRKCQWLVRGAVWNAGQGGQFPPTGGGGRFWRGYRASSSWHTGDDGLRWRWPWHPSSCFRPLPAQRWWRRRRLGVQILRVLLCFHCWQTATLRCGSVGDLYGFSCTRGYKPRRKLLYLSRCPSWELPGVVPSPPVFLTANLSQVTITAPLQRLEWSLLWAVAFAKPVVPSLAHCEINLHVPCLPSCPLTAAYFSPFFFLPILTGFLLRKITHPGS